jgi:hypothetical protein
MSRKTIVKLTQEMIDAVFSKPNLRDKFPNPQKAREICEMRLAGAIYTDISKNFLVSNYYCIDSVNKVKRLYTLFVER